ncbi:MAG: ATP-binding protein, partial [Burkholderiales bacterium]
MIDPLPAERLARRCDPGSFAFETTVELAGADDVIGQERADRAVEFGVAIRRDGYNLFVMGPTGSGKHTLVRKHIASHAADAEPPLDWVYVNNFDEPQKPIAIGLPPGRGATLRRDMEGLVEELGDAIPAVFDSEEYSARVESLDAEFNERHERDFAALGEEATQQKIALLRTPSGFSFAPVTDGEVITPEEFAKRPEEERERIQTAIAALQGKLEKLVRGVMRLRKERAERIRALNREMTLLAVGHVVSDLEERYRDMPRVVEYLEAVRRDVLDHADDFRKPADTSAAPGPMAQREAPSLRRYAVNVLVEHGSPDGAPVVTEDHPTFQNLVGRIEHLARFGALVTDFNLIKPGALHRANSGYLLIDAARILAQPFAWEGLKRALLCNEIRIESLGDMYGPISTVSIEPEAIPLHTKVVLFGDRVIYYL